MDIIDNLIFAALNDVTVPPVGGNPSFTRIVTSDYIDAPDIIRDVAAKIPSGPDPNGIFSYTLPVRDNFVHLDDTSVIEKSIQKHWFDVGDHIKYSDTVSTIFSDFLVPPYQLIYAYLIENTRAAQIFEKVISLAFHDEAFGIPDLTSNNNAMQWLVNTENLFFKELSMSSFRNISSQLRIFPEATRRNAYFRMFGMDLAFGDSNNQKGEYPYIKASANNSGFVVLFEQFIAEIWQAYINAKNTSGANTTDFEHIQELGIQLRDMLMSRRTSEADFTKYKYFNLSKEEYASVIMMSWFMNAITTNSSIVRFLKCEANSPDERLMKIGLKVGLPAHSKTKPLMEMAAPLAGLLRSVENKSYEDLNFIRGVLTSQTPNPSIPSPPATLQGLIAILNDLLTIINNWEKATGHRIKNPEANIMGTVRIQQPLLPNRMRQPLPANGKPTLQS